MNQRKYELAVELRHELHRHPELSMEERWTKQRLMDFLKEHTTQWEIVDRGRWFYAFRRGDAPEGAAAGKKIALRADFDALPMPDDIDAPWKSQFENVGHKCGHDGHAANLCLTALEIEEQGCANDVYLVFQHAEEIGGGGEECAELMSEVGIDEAYAFHTESGHPYDSMILRDGCVCFASKGMEITLTGAPAHASTPEHGRNPALAIAALIKTIPDFLEPSQYQGDVLATVIQVDIGERAFGVSAHKGKLLLTIRGEIEAEMDLLQKKLEDKALEQAALYGLDCGFAYYDEFPETRNDGELVVKIRKACETLGIPLADGVTPDRGSEDFGWFGKKTKLGYFCIGNGEDYPSVHDAKFDFIDEQMKTATAVFLELVK